MATKAERFKILRERRNKKLEWERQNKRPKLAMSMDVNSLWADLQTGMRLIFAPAGARKPIPQTRYMELYSNVYNYCCNVSVRPRRGFAGTRTGCYEGGQLYDRLSSFLEDHLYHVTQEQPLYSPDEEVLQFYVDKCDDYRFSARVLDGMFSYLNRHWVPVQRQTHPNVLETFPLALSCWKNTLYQNLNDRVTAAILRLITEERKGEIVHGHLIQTVIESYIELGAVDNTYPKVLDGSTNLAIYIKHFEDEFFEMTTEFYTLESNNYLAQHSVSEYMRKVEQRLLEEEGRVQKFLHHSTLPKLIHVCEQALIQPHLETFYSQFADLLKNNRTEDLRRLYNLVNRLNLEYTQGMSDQFRDHIIAFGLTSLKQLTPAGQNNPVEYFQKIFQIYKQFNELVILAFVSDMRFREALDKACKDFVNKNCVTEDSGNKNKSAFLLARYSDRLLKKNSPEFKNASDNDIENYLDELMAIFRFLSDKDVFQKHYSAFLANRLITGTSNSDEWERSLMSKLKAQCGQDYTVKVQRMFTDIDTTRTLSTQFIEQIHGTPKQLPYNFFIHVLTSGSWIYTQTDEFVFPPELEIARTNFTEFYNKQHNGRKLTWLAGRSCGEIKFQLPKSKPYTFIASTYQMAILLMFNNADQVTVGEMIDATKLELGIVEQVVKLLIKAEILTRAQNEDVDGPYTNDSILTLVNTFFSERWKISINTPLRSETRRETERVDQDVIKSRSFVIQATIVRIMKMRKTLRIADLTAEVMGQVSASFHPDPRMVQTAIEKLIEDLYIARDIDDRKTLNYVS